MTTTTHTTSAAAAEAADRARRVAEAVHSVRMEGLDVTPEWEADAAEAIAGRISADDLVSRTRARYGIGR
ncbi:MAG: antitoxin VbhA family protein [Dermatophilaceae bacterium]